MSGFAGLTTLVSNIPDVIREVERIAAEQTRTHSAPNATSQRVESAASATAAPSAAPHQPPERKLSLRWGRLAAVGGFIGLLILINQDSNNSPSQSTASSFAPAPTGDATPLNLSPAASVLDERRPGVGGGERIFDLPEIHYCLAEEIRLKSAEAAVNSRIDAEVERFNVYVDDYNTRCGQYRYQRGALERARSDVESHRASLQAEGRARFSGSSALPPTTSTTVATQSAESVNADPLSVNPSETESTAPAKEGHQREGKVRATTPPTQRTERERENVINCLSGEYPSLCNHSLLTEEEQTQVAAAERRANYQTCSSGEYPSLCRHELLTASEASVVGVAERRANYDTCISGQYPSLCRHDLLTVEQASAVSVAERRANYQTCISGLYPSLCNHALLTQEQAKLVADAERRVGRP